MRRSVAAVEVAPGGSHLRPVERDHRLALAIGIERVDEAVRADHVPAGLPQLDDLGRGEDLRQPAIGGIVDAVVKHFETAKAKGDKVAGQPIRDLVTVNGVRVTVEDGTWGLVRASSNKPELVVVVESPASEARMREMFKAVDGVLRTHPEVGEYNQTI